MNASTVAVDLAKSVFQLAVADQTGRVVEIHRLTRARFSRWFDNRSVGLVVMEARGSAHHWARTLIARGIAMKLLPSICCRSVCFAARLQAIPYRQKTIDQFLTFRGESNSKG